MENEHRAPDVPFIVHESNLARMERTIRRLWIIDAAVLVLLVVSNVYWISRFFAF